jgi:hypothetical protein
VSVIARFLIGGTYLAAGALAHAADLPLFDGQTSAGTTLKYEVLGVIGPLVRGNLGCSVVNRVSPRPLTPADRVPSEITLPRATPRVTWERWTVTACQKELAFVVAFWPGKGGGQEFRVAQEKNADS